MEYMYVYGVTDGMAFGLWRCTLGREGIVVLLPTTRLCRSADPDRTAKLPPP